MKREEELTAALEEIVSIHGNTPALSRIRQIARSALLSTPKPSISDGNNVSDYIVQASLDKARQVLEATEGKQNYNCGCIHPSQCDDTCYATGEATEGGAHEKDGYLIEENRRLREALELCMVGGNHLANVLIENVGAGFAERFPPDTDHEIALRSLCATDNYEVWCCWSAIMRARAALNAKPEGSDNG